MRSLRFACAMLCAFAAVAAHASAASDAIRVEVHGLLSRANEGAFEIRIGSTTWEVDTSASEALRSAAASLAGKRAVAKGAYAETRSGGNVRRVLRADQLLPERMPRGDVIEITARGIVKTGVMAIGAETTGTTLTADGVTWELELTRAQEGMARNLSGQKVTVSGRLRYQEGVEVRRRGIVKVRSIAPA